MVRLGLPFPYLFFRPRSPLLNLTFNARPFLLYPIFGLLPPLVHLVLRPLPYLLFRPARRRAERRDEDGREEDDGSPLHAPPYLAVVLPSEPSPRCGSRNATGPPFAQRLLTSRQKFTGVPAG